MLDKTVTLLDIVLAVAPKDHIYYGQGRNSRVLFYAPQRILLEVIYLARIAYLFDAIKCRNKESTCPASGVINNV